MLLKSKNIYRFSWKVIGDVNWNIGDVWYLQNAVRAEFKSEQDQEEIGEFCKLENLFTENRTWLNMKKVDKIKEY